MADNRQRLTYRDVDRFEGSAVRKIAEPERRHERRRKPEVFKLNFEQLRSARLSGVNPIIAVSLVACISVMLVLLFNFIGVKAQLTAYTEQIESAEFVLADLQSTEIQLQMQAVQNSTRADIEEYATVVLGMSKVSSDNIKYIAANKADGGYIAEGAEELSYWDKFLKGVKSLFS